MNSDEAHDIDQALRALHGSADSAGLAAIHVRAARILNTPAAKRFHLPHAWVYALVSGDDQKITALEKALRELGGL